MKLKLNNSLRVALMACYAFTAPIATTLSTGAIVTGVALTLLAPQAMAENTDYYVSCNTTNGGAFLNKSGVLYADKGDAESSVSYLTSEGNWYTSYASTKNNRLVFANSTDYAAATGLELGSGTQTFYFDSSLLCFAGITVLEGATGYSLTTAAAGATTTSTRNIALTGSDTSSSDSRAVFEISEDFSLYNSSSSTAAGYMTIYADVDISVASEKTFTIQNFIFTNSTDITGTIYLTGEGTFSYNLSGLSTQITSADTAYNWNVSGGVTFDLSDNTAENIDAILGTSTITVSTGKVLVTTGATITNNISIEGANSIVTAGAGGKITLDGSLSLGVDDEGDLFSLNAGGSTLTFGNDFSIVIDASLTAGEYDIITDFTSDSDYDFTVIGYDFTLQSATLAVDAETGNLQLILTDLDVTELVYSGGTEFNWGVGETDTNFNNGTSAYSDETTVTFNSSTMATLTSDIAPDYVKIGDGVTLTIGSADNEGGVFTLDTDAVLFTGASSLVLTADVLGDEVKIGIAYNTEATFEVNVDGGTMDYSKQLNGFAGNLVMTAGNLTIGTVEDGNSSLGLNAISVDGGELNIDIDLNVTNAITVTGGVANFNEAVSASSLEVSGGTATFTDDFTASTITLSGGTLNFTGTNSEGAVAVTMTNSAVMNMTNAVTDFVVTIGANNVLNFSGTGNEIDYFTVGGNYMTIRLQENAEATFTYASVSDSHSAYRSHVDIELGAGSTLTLDQAIWTSGSSIWDISTLAGETEGGTLQLEGLILSYDSGNGTMTVGSGTTVEITGATFNSSSSSSSFIVGGGSGTGTLNINGTFISDVGVVSYGSSATGVINVNSGGNLVLNSGLMAAKGYDASTLTMYVSGTLTLGNQTDETAVDYSDIMTVNVNTGATITDNGTEGGVTVDTTLTYATDATVNFVGSEDGSLTMAKAVTNATDDTASTVSANIAGDVTFAAGADLVAVSIAEGSSLTLSGAYLNTIGSVAGSGTLSVASDATLRIESDSFIAADSDVTVSLAGTLELGEKVSALNLSDFSLSGSSLNIDLDGSAVVLSNANTSDFSSSAYHIALTGSGSVSGADWFYTSSVKVTEGTSLTISTNVNSTTTAKTISGAGNVEFAVTGSNYTSRMYLSGFTGTLIQSGTEGIYLTIDTDTQTADNRFGIDTSATSTGIVLGTVGATYYIDSLTGSGTIRADWTSSSAARTIDLEMIADNVFSGTFNSDSRFGALIVSSADEIKTFTLSGTGYTGSTASLTIDDANVVLSGGAKWSGSIILDGSNASLTYQGISTSGYTQSSSISGTGSVAIEGSSLTFSSALEASSLSIVDSTTVTFNDAVTVTEELSLVNSDGYYDADNNFLGAVKAGSITIQYGYHDFSSTVDVTGAITLNGGISTFDGAVTANSIAANDGTTSFNSSVSVTDSFTIGGGSVSVATLTGAGDVTVSSNGSLTLGSDTNYTGTLSLAGGSLVAFSGTLGTDILVTTAGSSLSATELNSTITLSDNVSLALSGVTSLGSDFSLDLSNWEMADGMSASYTVFTGVESNLSELTNWGVTGLDYSTDSYEIAWNVDASGNLSFSFTEINNAPSWTDDDTVYEIPTDTDSSTNITVNTDDAATGSEPTIATGSSDAGTTTTGNVDIMGDSDVSITGDNALASSGLITVGSLALATSTDVTISTTVSAEKGIDVVNGSVTVDGNGKIDSTSVSLAESTTLSAGDLTVTGNTDGATLTLTDSGSITSNSISGATISGATITVGTLGASGLSVMKLSFDATAYTSTIVDSTIKSDSTVSIAVSKSLGLNNVTIEAGASFTGEATSSLTAIDVTINASAGAGLTITDSLTYSIDTFSLIESVTLGGELNLNIELNQTQYDTLVSALGSNGASAIFTLEGVDSANELTIASLTIEVAGTSYAVSNYDSSGNLSFTVVEANIIPEPSTSALSLLALAGLLARRRRKA